MEFSRRTQFELRPNRLSEALARARRGPDELLDLTESNPTRCGLPGPTDAALASLADPGVRSYQPAPFGLPAARAAVVRYYAERGVAVAPERVVLTASTSEAYAYAFKLLADPGDDILAPAPSYPLFEYLARLDGVRLTPHRLRRAAGFELDPGAIERGLTAGARAVIVVSPNNPTGSSATSAELEDLDARAAAHGAAVISDEVFADFPFSGSTPAPIAAAVARRALTLSLSGLSKVCGTPQIKLAWMVLGGPDKLVEAALARLEVIADTYLSVATPAQTAAAALLSDRGEFQRACRKRLEGNRKVLAESLAQAPELELLPADGGWSACLRIPAIDGEEAVALRLLEEDRVAVHPGYFYDFPQGAHLVVSLIVPKERFAAGVERMVERLRGR